MNVPGHDVLALLARSNVLDVYDGWSHERDCRVVLKTLRPDRRSDRRARAALLREGRLLRRLAHPHLVRGFEVIEGSPPVVVLETLGGETLAALIERRERRLSARELGYLGLHLCSAVGYLHRHGLLHLDLKPSNVIAEAGRAKVIDLSVARRPGRVPAGYDTRLGQRGRTLSGGQRQRIAIARALVRDTPVLVLDEPTTGLDADAKAALLEPLRALAAGRTTILISHDPDVIAWADRVIHVEDGRVAEAVAA